MHRSRSGRSFTPAPSTCWLRISRRFRPALAHWSRSAAATFRIPICIRNKQQQELRLLKLLDSATKSLEEIFRVEQEVSRVREEVERMQGRLRVLQDVTALSTITLQIHEIDKYRPQPQVALIAPLFGERLDQAALLLRGGMPYGVNTASVVNNRRNDCWVERQNTASCGAIGPSHSRAIR